MTLPATITLNGEVNVYYQGTQEEGRNTPGRLVVCRYFGTLKMHVSLSSVNTVWGQIDNKSTVKLRRLIEKRPQMKPNPATGHVDDCLFIEFAIQGIVLQENSDSNLYSIVGGTVASPSRVALYEQAAMDDLMLVSISEFGLF